MWEFLKARNRMLERNLEELTTAIQSASIPSELEYYRSHIISVCNDVHTTVEQNIADLGLGQDQILEDVLSNTQQVMRLFRLLSARLAVPILRASSSDRLSLTVLSWLHGQHQKTASIPAAFADGHCSVWTFRFAPIYFFPCVEQKGLLYQPLLFHEFGHLLYAAHEREMDDLVGELQKAVEEYLIPQSRRNDRHADTQAGQRQEIVNTWYRWAQELFCDAVGLTIGGPCFLLAFSQFLGTLENGDFYRQPTDLRYSGHPVTWLRVQFIAERAKQSGFERLAMAIEQEWKMLAHAIGVVEDYHGFYDRRLKDNISRTIDDMLTEAAPRRYTEAEVKGMELPVSTGNLISLLNQAWQVYRTNALGYTVWENKVLQSLLA